MTKQQDYTALNAYRYLTDQWKNHRDLEAGAKLLDMIVAGELKCTPRNDGRLLFRPNRYKGSICRVCHKENEIGEYIFVLNKKACCISCSSDEDKELSYYKKWAKKQSEMVQHDPTYVPPSDDWEDNKNGGL